MNLKLEVKDNNSYRKKKIIIILKFFKTELIFDKKIYTVYTFDKFLF